MTSAANRAKSETRPVNRAAGALSVKAHPAAAARRLEFDPPFEWLTGLEGVNYHTGSFRVEKRQRRMELFTQLLGVLSAEGLITLESVM
jgi:hypothetical protein